MGKYLELFLGEVGDLTEKTKLENKPYVAYSTKEGKVVYTVVPAKDPVVEGPADNEIWYTTVDGNITSYDVVSFGANLISNTYENGKGIMVFDGPVGPALLGGAFEYSDVANVILPNSIKSLDYRAFSHCYYLESVTLSSNVTDIGNHDIGRPVFSHSGDLNIIYKSTREQWNKINIHGDALDSWRAPRTVTVHCTDGDIIIQTDTDY